MKHKEVFTVGDLIKELKEYPNNFEVHLLHRDGSVPVNSLEIVGHRSYITLELDYDIEKFDDYGDDI